MLNEANIIGYLGQDPELRYTQSQVPVATMSVATTSKWKGADGQMQEHTEWHRVIVWNQQAENCSKYLSKGRLVMVKGELRTRSWDDKDGVKRYTTEIQARNVIFLPDGKGKGDRPPAPGDDARPPQQGQQARGGNGGGRAPQQSQSAPPPAEHGGYGGPETPGLDDIPF